MRTKPLQRLETVTADARSSGDATALPMSVMNSSPHSIISSARD
jgi:hypothetical protein